MRRLAKVCSRSLCSLCSGIGAERGPADAIAELHLQFDV